MDNLRKSINSVFKINGLAINSEATSYLHEILKEFNDRMQGVWLDKIIDKIQRQSLTNSLITKEIVEAAAKECGKGDDHSQDDILTVLSAFEIPKLTYDVERKKFLLNTTPQNLLCSATDKPQLYRNRYAILLQRTLHHELFTPSIQGIEWDGDKKKFNLKAVEYLSGTTGKIADVVILGMITQIKEGKYFLEDPTGSVQLDLSDAKFHTGFYTESSFVLAEGFYEDQVFHVNAMGLPPPEPASITRAYYGTTNFFGGANSGINKERLQIIEKQNEEAMFVILSDVHLDEPAVLQKLRILFEGFAEARPILFIFMGNFLSEPRGAQSSLPLRNAFNNLADILVEFPTLLGSSKFVFVPGPLDPGFVNILPRPPFADIITQNLREKVPNAIFATNPCRIKYCTKEIIVLREDIFTKMCRNSIYFQTEGDIPEHFVKTLIGQSHLCPLPLHICPVYWSYDHAMSLYPLPDLVIIGDKGDPFSVTHHGCIFTNPGSFVKTNFAFKTYTPYENKLDECQLPQEP